jgi:hypothetical protein
MKSRFHPGLCVGLVAAGLALLPAAAQAQTADPGAPAAGTPPANQYQIPLQAGRRDAAPPKAQRNPNPGSLYRSDNNFGSSSIIPGDPRSGGGDGGAGGAGGTGDNPAGSGPGAGSGSGSVSGSGSSDDGGGLDTGAPSEVAAYTTLPLIVLLGAVIGVAGVRMRRRAEL